MLRYRVVVAAVRLGIRGIRIAETFVHLDMDRELIRPSMWGYRAAC